MSEIDYNVIIPLDLTKVPFEFQEFDPQNQFSGIYACYCTSNNKFYVGSTKDFLPTKIYRGRKADHLNSLRKGSHDNVILQRAFDKYGEFNFFWFKLEGDIKRENLLDREDYYLAKYRPFDREIGFNINKKATGGNPNFKSILSRYKFVKLSGEIVEGENLSKFARDNKVWLRYLLDLKFGKRDYYKGFISFDNIHRLEEIKSAIEEKRCKQYFKVISPTGELLEGFDRKDFCKKHQLKLRIFRDLLAGRIIKTSGWRLFNANKHPDRSLTLGEVKSLNEKEKIDRYQIETKVRFNGKIIEITNVRQFCKRNNLSPDSMFRIGNGQRKTEYRGYTSLDEETHKQQIRNSIRAIAINQRGEFVKLRHISGFCKKFDIKITDIGNHSRRNKFINGYSFIFNTEGISEEQERSLLEEKRTKLFPDNPDLVLREIEQEYLQKL